MESRYALRGLQGAIGNDCRRLEDGRKAVFRHTVLHKRARIDYYERRDAMLVLHASFMSVASLGSHARVDLEKAAEIVDEDRRMFIQVAFPYVHVEHKKTMSEEEENEMLFDEYEAMMKKDAEEKAKSKPTENVEKNDGPVGQE